MKLRFVIDKEYDISKAKYYTKEDEKSLAFVEEQYKTSLKFLELSRALYQDAWDEINDDFSEYIKNMTGYDWFYPEYTCVISVFFGGRSNWGHSPKIARIWKENPYYARRITAYELILSHYFEIHRRHYKEAHLTDGQIWALGEIAAMALISLTEEVKDFWPWGTEYSTNHNYPNIVELQNKLKPIFLNRKNFDEYIKAGIELVKEYPTICPPSRTKFS
jgi:hypothetical protein